MALSQSQRLRRNAEKDKRRKVVVADKRRVEIVESAGSSARQVAEAARSPIRACLMSSELFESGIGSVLLARTLPSGRVASGVFLLDVFCLGVKDAYFRVDGREAFEMVVEKLKSTQPLAPVDPSVARKLVEAAVAYARSLGFQPSGDFELADAIFGDTPLAPDEFTFGNDGKPYFVSGPLDSPAKIRKILATLEEHVGAGNYDFTVRALGL